MKKELVNSVSNIRDLFFKIKNRNRYKILVYTDSRGYNVIGRLGKIPFYSYISMLQFKYNVTYKICPEKYTTILDFLNYINQSSIDNYDVIIMHCGIVDFSPRPLSNITNFKITKANTKNFDKMFADNETYYEHPFNTMYNDEPTINIYSKDYLLKNIIPKLKLFRNLIWINSNKFVENWEGNYTKGRPKNINCVVNKFDKIMKENLKNVINIRDWSSDEIKKYTIDNIHFSRYGFKKMYQLLDKEIERLTNNDE